MKATMKLRGVRVLLLSAAVMAMGALGAKDLYAQGQGRMDPAARMAQRMELLTTRLKLTPDEVAKIKPVLQKQSDDMQAMMQKARQGGNMDFSAMRPQMQASREATDKAIEAVLTPDQKTAYEALMKEEAAQRANRMGGGA